MILDAIIVVRDQKTVLAVERFVKPGVKVVAPRQQLAGIGTKAIILACDLRGEDALDAAINEIWYRDDLMCRLVPADLSTRQEPPVFTKRVCMGSFLLGSACGNCERCDWARNQQGGF